MKAGRRRPHSLPVPLSATRESHLVPLSCPDCFGVLRFEREGPKSHLIYCCQVDHRYSPTSLLHAKEAQLERTLWSAALLLKQIGYAYEDLLEEIKKTKGAERTPLQRRINEVRKQCLAIRAMIEASHAIE